MAEILQSWGWNAKPLQAVRGTQGRAWEIGATNPPPQRVLRTQDGFLTLTPIKDLTAPQPRPQVIATARTKQQIKQDAVQPAASVDNSWGPEGDPWSQWLKKPNSSQAVPTTPLKPGEAQSKLQEVENRLQADVQKKVREELEEISRCNDSAHEIQNSAQEARLQQLESHIVEIQHQGQRFETYFAQAQQQAEGQQKCIEALQQQALQQQHASASLHESVQLCNDRIGQQHQGLQALATEVQAVQQSFETKLDIKLSQQTDRLEALLIQNAEAEAKRLGSLHND